MAPLFAPGGTTQQLARLKETVRWEEGFKATWKFENQDQELHTSYTLPPAFFLS